MEIEKFEFDGNEYNSFILDNNELELIKTFNCGQCFSWYPERKNVYSGFIGDKLIVFVLSNKEVEGHTRVIVNAEEDFIRNEVYGYLNMQLSYLDIMRSLRLETKDKYAYLCHDFSKGIHIIKQPLFETIFTFIVSSSNTMGNIQKSIERFRRAFGKKYECDMMGVHVERYSFPEIDELKGITEEQLRKCRFGFRSKYLKSYIDLVSRGEFSLDILANMKGEQAVKYLKTLDGVGDKVANCVSLFALNDYSMFPIDTHIKDIIDREYMGSIDVGLYGDYPGIIQQFMFYAETHIN